MPNTTKSKANAPVYKNQSGSVQLAVWENEAKVNQEAVDFIRAKGVKVHELTPDQRKAWQDAVAPVWSELGEKVAGAEVMARLKEISAKYPAK